MHSIPPSVMLSTFLFHRDDSDHKLRLLGQLVTSDVSMVDNDEASGLKLTLSFYRRGDVRWIRATIVLYTRDTYTKTMPQKLSHHWFR